MIKLKCNVCSEYAGHVKKLDDGTDIDVDNITFNGYFICSECMKYYGTVTSIYIIVNNAIRKILKKRDPRYIGSFFNDKNRFKKLVKGVYGGIVEKNSDLSINQIADMLDNDEINILYMKFPKKLNIDDLSVKLKFKDFMLDGVDPYIPASESHTINLESTF